MRSNEENPFSKEDEFLIDRKMFSAKLMISKPLDFPIAIASEGQNLEA
jgi:hypothetical protein